VPEPDRPVGRTALVLVPIALVSRGAAFLVPLVIAMWFGVGDITDAWYWALAFPTFALVLASTSLGTAATPAMARVRQHNPERLPAFLGGLLVWTSLGSALLGLAICLLAWPALPALTEFNEETRALAARFLWELLPFMVLTSAGAVLRVACEVHGRFFGVAVTPMVRAAAVIGSTAALLGPIGPHALPWGLVIGEVVQVAWWAAMLARIGLRPRPTLALDPAVAEVGRDLAPILGGEVLVALNLVVDKAFAAVLPPGSVATLEYADRARVIPQTLLESTLLMVAYASWSNLRAAGRVREARAAIDQSLRWVLALAAAPLAGMFIGRFVLVSLLYERGAFTPDDTLRTASALAWYLPGVLPNLLGILAVRAHVVERNLRLIFVLGMVSVAANGLLNALLMGPMGLDGLALATTLNMLLIPGVYLWMLRDRVAPQPGPWLAALGVAAAAAAVAVGVELGPGPPRSLLDPVLWIAAVACFGLLGLAWRVTRPPAAVGGP